MDIQPAKPLSFDLLSPLLKESVEEGYDFIQSLWDEYKSGKTTFNGQGETLLSISEENQLIAIGGVHKDPYLQSPTSGRIRHVYVRQAYRRNGAGKQLVEALVEYASHEFSVITLRTLTEHGQSFYKSLGFSDSPRFKNATHWLEIKIL
ncbi:MAG: GNAT family N-acetyltransferase [Anaerolineae bacterium]